MTPSPRRCQRARHESMQRDREQCFTQVEAAVVNGALVAALAQLIPVRFHLGQLVLHAGEQTAKARCDSVERCSGPVTPPPPRPPL